MNPVFRLLLTALIGFFVIAGAEFLRADADADADLPPVPIRGGGLDDGAEYDAVPGAKWEHAAKVALGNNANAVLSLDLIANGGAGNRTDDGVTTGAVSGRGAKIALEIFATGVTTTLRGVVLRFDFDAPLVSFVKAENSAFSLSLPEGSVGAALAATSPGDTGVFGFPGARGVRDGCRRNGQPRSPSASSLSHSPKVPRPATYLGRAARFLSAPLRRRTSTATEPSAFQTS